MRTVEYLPVDLVSISPANDLSVSVIAAQVVGLSKLVSTERRGGSQLTATPPPFTFTSPNHQQYYKLAFTSAFRLFTSIGTVRAICVAMARQI